MTTKLVRPVRREILIDGEPFTVVISPQGIRLTRKRFRTGRGVSWKVIWEGLERAAREGAREGSHDGAGHATGQSSSGSLASSNRIP